MKDQKKEMQLNIEKEQSETSRWKLYDEFTKQQEQTRYQPIESMVKIEANKKMSELYQCKGVVPYDSSELLH